MNKHQDPYPPNHHQEPTIKEIQMNKQNEYTKNQITESIKSQHPNATPEFYALYTNLLYSAFTEIEFYDFTLTFTGDKHEPDSINLSITPHYGS